MPNIACKYIIDATNPATGNKHDHNDAVLFLAKDQAFLDILIYYPEACRKRGATQDQITAAELLVDRVHQYQIDVECKVPDIAGGQERTNTIDKPLKELGSGEEHF